MIHDHAETTTPATCVTGVESSLSDYRSRYSEGRNSVATTSVANFVAEAAGAAHGRIGIIVDSEPPCLNRLGSFTTAEICSLAIGVIPPGLVAPTLRLNMSKYARTQTALAKPAGLDDRVDPGVNG